MNDTGDDTGGYDTEKKDTVGNGTEGDTEIKDKEKTDAGRNGTTKIQRRDTGKKDTENAVIGRTDTEGEIHREEIDRINTNEIRKC